MLGNSIRGGQIFWHQLTMLRQVILRSLSVSLAVAILVTGFMVAPKLPEHDLTAAYSYFKAEMADWWSKNRLLFGISVNSGTSARERGRENLKEGIATIDAYDSSGLYAKNIRARTILAHGNFRAEYIKAKSLLEYVITMILAISISLLAAIFIIWSIFGKKARETKLLRGGIILTDKEAASILKKYKIASDLKIGDMPLVKDAETKHILVTGATGSGKTNLFHTLLPQIRDKNQPALVIDQTGEMIARYYDPDRGDIIFNPFDKKSHEWNFWEEVSEPSRLNSMATSLFCNIKTSDDMWNNASKQLFMDAVNFIAGNHEVAPAKLTEPTISKLHELIVRTPLREASKKLKGYASSALLDPAGDRTAMSIRSNTIAFINWLEYLPQTKTKKKFSLKHWIPDTVTGYKSSKTTNGNGKKEANKDKQANKGNNNTKIKGRWLFISSRPEERTLLKPLQSLLLDMAVLGLQKLEPNPKRRFWIIADELASLKKLDILPQSLAELRKYGGCIMTALQSLNQLYEIYGHNNASSMFGQFATKFMFRTSEPQIARMISEMFGSVEYKEQQQNTSYGAHEHRDGISYTEQERRKALVTVDDLAGLADLECFVSLPDTRVRLTKMKMRYKL